VLEILCARPAEVQLDLAQLSTTINEICKYHAPLQHGFEVAYALLFAIRFGCPIDDEIAELISRVEDDSVALVCMHARELGLLNAHPEWVWESWLSKDHLNLEHWLAAYELPKRGWLFPSNRVDYVGQHDFFWVLRELDVSFYDTTKAQAVEPETIEEAPYD